MSESYRYIVRSVDVRGGNARVEGTRIGVHDVIGLLQNGESVESITATCLPMLTKAQVYECLAYYEDHRGEIEPAGGPTDGARSAVKSCPTTTYPRILPIGYTNSANQVLR